MLRIYIGYLDLKQSSGGSRGGAAPPLFVDQTEAQRAEKQFFETAPPPTPPTLSEGLDSPTQCVK